MSEKVKTTKKKKTPKKVTLTKERALTDRELDLARKVFSIKHPYIDFSFNSYIREKIYEDAFAYGVAENSLPVSYSQIVQRITTLHNDMNNFLSVMNKRLTVSTSSLSDAEAVVAENSDAAIKALETLQVA